LHHAGFRICRDQLTGSVSDSLIKEKFAWRIYTARANLVVAIISAFAWFDSSSDRISAWVRWETREKKERKKILSKEKAFITSVESRHDFPQWSKILRRKYLEHEKRYRSVEKDRIPYECSKDILLRDISSRRYLDSRNNYDNDRAVIILKAPCSAYLARLDIFALGNVCALPPTTNRRNGLRFSSRLLMPRGYTSALSFTWRLSQTKQTCSLASEDINGGVINDARKKALITSFKSPATKASKELGARGFFESSMQNIWPINGASWHASFRVPEHPSVLK